MNTIITKELFCSYWIDNCGNIPPIGHILRKHFFDNRWFRIHSLPNSKRYADNDEEMQIILYRQNYLIADLIGENNPYLLLLSVFSEQPESDWFLEFDGAVKLDNIPLNKVMPEYYECEWYQHLSFVNNRWKSGCIDDYLKTIANDGRIIDINDNNSSALLIVDLQKNRIIAPYDGGVDIFLNNEKERDFFKLKYKDWLSFTESGL